MSDECRMSKVTHCYSQGCQHHNYKIFFLYICQYFDISERRLGDIIFPILNIQAKTALIVGLFWNFSFQLTNPHYCP